MTTIAQPFPYAPGPRLAAAPVTRPRVLFLLEEYPQTGQTHIRSEIESLAADYEIGIIALRPAAQPYPGHRPFTIAATLPEIIATLQTFAPDLLHAHDLTMLGVIAQASRVTGIPFTLRTHSRDTLPLRPQGFAGLLRRMLRGDSPPERIPAFQEGLKAIDSELCLGVLGLPFARPWLTRAGVRAAKLVDCFPAVPFARFHDRSPNGDAVMGIGAGTPGKALDDFQRLARKVPGRSFNLYSPHGAGAGPEGAARAKGSGVTSIGPLEPDDMPREYKKHRWLVLTADAAAAQTGWPKAVAEAQAAGVGVCIPALRPDLALYVGEGAGLLYDSVDELPAIVSGPVPEEMRERGFEQARKSDIERHRHLLTDLWDDALRTRAAEGRAPPPAGAANAPAVPVPASGVATPA
jgi:hypothetical protein